MLEIEELPPSAWSSMASAPLQGEFEDAPEDYSAHSDSSSDSSVREGLQRLWPRGARKRSHSESGGEESESESEGGRRKVQAVAGEEVEVFMMEL